MLNQVISDSSDGIVVAADDGTILSASRAAGIILRIEHARSLVGLDVRDLLPEPLVAEGLAALTETTPGATSHRSGEITVDDGTGGTIVLEYTVTPSLLGGTAAGGGALAAPRHVVTYRFRDVTAERAEERAIREAAEAAIASNAAKTAFLANMSHELRTPLNAILGFSDIIRNQSFGPIAKDEYVEFAREIHASGGRLLEILNDILEVTRTETGEIELNDEPTEVDRLIEAAFRTATSPEDRQDRSISTTVAPNLPMLLADERRIRTAIANLIDNAVKFTETGGHVGVSAAVNDAGELEIAVVDDGIGIPADEIDKVTGPFYQIDTALSRLREGNGLGLTVAKAYLAAHGARLELASEPDRGTEARAIFPASRVGVRGEKARTTLP